MSSQSGSQDGTSREKAQQQLISVVKKIAVIAGSTQKILSYFLLLGIVSTAYLVWLSYSPESNAWWACLKAGLLIWPVLILGFSWSVLGQLSEVPESAEKLKQDSRVAYSGMKEVKVREPKGLRGMIGVLYRFQREGSYSVIFDTVGGISLLLSPFFLFLVALAVVLVILLSFTGLLIVIF